MKPNTIPPRHTPPRGVQPETAANTPRTLRCKTEDFEKHIHGLPKEKQDYARGLFPEDSTGRWREIGENKYKAFMTILDRNEQKTFGRLTPKLKDNDRTTPQPAPKARRPAKGEDLRAPIGSQGLRKSGRGEGPYPPSSGKAHGRPSSESAKPPHRSLADLLAAEKAGRDIHLPSQTRTPDQPKRVGFAELAPVRLIPRGEDFNPGEFHAGWPHQVYSGPKAKPGRYVPVANHRLAQRISIPDATTPKRETQGQEAPYPLNDPSYPPAPPAKGILKKPTEGENPSAQSSGTKKALKWGAAAVGGIALTGLTAFGVTKAVQDGDSSSDASGGT